jgi:two-component system, OmpR family, response regulator
MHILLIEDDAESASYVLKGLQESGHVIDHAADGHDGLHLAITGQYDVLIVDRMLPGRDGLSIIKMLRADGNLTPVLILSALAEVGDRVEGLRAGGDDYLVKPFAFSELLARLEALDRRQQTDTSKENKLKLLDLEFDLVTHKVTRNNKILQLQPKELKLLEYFLRHTNQIITRTMLLENVWDLHFDPQTNVVDTQISRLRNKIDKDFDHPLLHTIRGTGYRLSEIS